MENFFVDLSKSLEEDSLGKNISLERRENFLEYLVSSGVHAGLSTALKLLYDEPAFPNDPVDYIRSHLGKPRVSTPQFKAMKKELNKHRRRIGQLEHEIEIAKAKLAQEEDDTIRMTEDLRACISDEDS